MHRNSHVISAVLILGMAAGIFAAAGCQDSDLPTAPAGSISGSWRGTWDPVSTLCPGSGATAYFTQDGATVRGWISASSPVCGFPESAFVGRIDGDHVQGTFEGGVIDGRVVDRTLLLDLDGLQATLSGRFELHR